MTGIEYIEYTDLLPLVQKYLTTNHPAEIQDAGRSAEVKAQIRHYVASMQYAVRELPMDQLVEQLHRDMCAYSFLSLYLDRADIEEININAWDDVAVHYVDGSIKKIEHFYSQEHAKSIIIKLLNASKMSIDGAKPAALGFLENHARISALIDPIIDNEQVTAASIRLLRPSTSDVPWLLDMDTATQEMFDFLQMCMIYKVSCLIAGAPYAGKTTLANALLKRMPDDKRIFTIESGNREVSLIKRDAQGNVLNNVIHTLTRPSAKAEENITQEDLVNYSLRFNPDLVFVGETRDAEAYSAVDAAMTGYTVVSTIHAFYAADAHLRLASLCLRRHEMSLDVAQMLAAKAFPIVAYAEKLGRDRKIMDISECEITDNGKRKYHTLYRYVVEDNEIGKNIGRFEKVEDMSLTLQKRFISSGAPRSLVAQFLRKEKMA